MLSLVVSYCRSYQWPVALSAMILLTMTGASGCMLTNDYEPELRSATMEHLQVRYGQDFVILRVSQASNPFTGKPYDRVYVEVPGGGGEFLVKRHSEDGSYRFEDGYSYHLAANHISPALSRSLVELEPGTSMALEFGSTTKTTLYEYSGQFDWEAFRLAEAGGATALIDVVLPRAREDDSTESTRLYPLMKAIDAAIGPMPWNVRIWYVEASPASFEASELLGLESEQVRAKYTDVSLVVLWREGPDDPAWSMTRVAEQLESARSEP